MNNEHFYLIAKMTAAPGKYMELRERLLEMVRLTKHESSMVTYDLYEDLQDSENFCFIESWKSREDWNVHMEMPHVKALIDDQYQLTAGIQITTLGRL
jgi:quinol monooxygenase YgiN